MLYTCLRVLVDLLLSFPVHALQETVLEGVVVDEVGNPVGGATLLTEIGAHARTKQDGSYRLVLPVSRDHAEVELVALGESGSNLVARTRVLLGVGGRAHPVPALRLLPGPSCTLDWIPTFGGPRGIVGVVRDFLVFDDGSGPALYVGGAIESAGGVVPSDGVVRLDGSGWTALGGAGSGANVYDLEVFDAGSGPELYASGLVYAGGVFGEGIARWDGSAWVSVGGGLSVGNGAVQMAVFDDGPGPALFAAGTSLRVANGSPADGLARWDGTSWTAVGSGLMRAGGTPSASALQVFDDGTGPGLYVGGFFDQAGGLASPALARRDASGWSALGGGLGGPFPPRGDEMSVWDPVGGAELVVHGFFDQAGGTPAPGWARWDGATWRAIPDPMAGAPIDDLAAFDAGAGELLLAASEQLFSFDGSRWSVLEDPAPAGFSELEALEVLDLGSGPRLFSGGVFSAIGGTLTSGVAAWDGSTWDAVGAGDGLNGAVEALAEFDSGDGMELYVGGNFSGAGAVPLSGIARWDGTAFHPLGSGLSGGALVGVGELQVFDGGGGVELIVGGTFSEAGGLPAQNIARWDGSAWSSLGSGLDNGPFALEVHDDGSGVELYVGGAFTVAGGASVANVARWDGSSWGTVGAGVPGTVFDLEVFDAGAGPRLFAAVQGPGAAPDDLYEWDGAVWTVALPGRFRALEVHDDGSGSQLYLSRTFDVARWDGITLTPLPAVGSGFVFDFQAFGSGGGADLYLAGFFAPPGLPNTSYGRWDGTQMHLLGAGATGVGLALAVHDNGKGPALFAGGAHTLLGVEESYLSKWGCADGVPPVISCPADFTVADRPNYGGEVVTFNVTATDDQDPDPSVNCVPSSGSVFARGTTTVTCTATDASGNEAQCTFTVTVGGRERRTARPRRP